MLIFVTLIRHINTKLLKSCSESQKLLKVAKIGKGCSKLQKLLKSCQAQSVWAYWIVGGGRGPGTYETHILEVKGEI